VLGSCDLVAFVATTDAARARDFYGEALGLRLVEETPFAYVFEAHGTTLRVTMAERVTPAACTVLGWTVPDIARAIRALEARGVGMVGYEGLDQDELGLWRAPGGASIAWFKDPDGNTLSVSQP
jgi:catechol 2,3-dioxygenase-like lactoylglutathione lyase family enzyme